MQLAALVLFLTRPEFAERAQRVKALSLTGNSLTDHHLAMLLDGLQGFAHLERVDLSCNLLGQKSVQLLNDILMQSRAKCVRVCGFPACYHASCCKKRRICQVFGSVSAPFDVS